MAFGTKTSAIYFSCTQGKLVRQLKAKTERSVERVNKMGATVHEEHYDYVSGVMTKIDKKVKEYGVYWHIHMQDEGENYIIELPYSSGYTNGFFFALPNIDITKKVTIIPDYKKEGDKARSTIFLSQNGKVAKWHYTKDNPNGMPELKKIKKKGKEEWDDTDRMEFIENYVNQQVNPKLATPAIPAANDEDQAPADDDDDVTF